MDINYVMELIREDKISAAKTRMEESIKLLDQATETIKSSIKSTYDNLYLAKKDEILQRIIKMYGELMKTSNKEIELYIEGTPQTKQESFQYLQNAAPKLPKKRGPRSSSQDPELVNAFDEDFRFMINELENSGVDITNEVILADGSFLYMGHCYTIGETVTLTKFNNQILQAKISVVTTAEVVLSFSDGSSVKIYEDDLRRHKIVLNNVK